MNKIIDNNEILCIYGNIAEAGKGAQWYGDEMAPIQVSTWKHEKGTVLKAHRHKVHPREIKITQECLIVFSGEIEVKVYGFRNRLVDIFYMHAGDFAIFYRGGHGYEITQEDTQAIEVKNGPFISVEKDKEYIS